MNKVRSTALNQKGLAHIFLLFILGLGIIAGVYLVQHPQIFKPKAAKANIAVGINECTKTDSDGVKSLICAQVPLELISPLETGNAAVSDAGFSFVKTAYAANPDTYCKLDVDPNKTFHKEKICNPILGIFCITWLSSRVVEIPEDCPSDQVCESTTTDLFNTVAKCVPGSSQPVRNFQPTIIVQPGSTGNKTLPVVPPAGSNAPAVRTSTSTSAPTPSPTLIPTPTSAATNILRATPTPTAPSTPALTSAPTATPIPASPTPTTSSINPSPSPTAIARTTKGYRVAESPTALDTAVWHDDYKVGGVSYTYPLNKDTKPGSTVTLFVEFRDQDEKTIKFSSGNKYASVSIEFPAPAVSSSPTPTAKPTPTPTPATARPTPTPTPVPTVVPEVSCKVDEPQRDCTRPTEKCEISSFADLDKCTNAQLLGTLTPEQLGQIPGTRVETFSNNAIMCFFPKSVIATLSTERLQQFNNTDLLLIADSTGDCKEFLSHFSCSTRLSDLPQYIRNMVCGY